MSKLSIKEFEESKKQLMPLKDAAEELGLKTPTLYSYLTKSLCGFQFYLGPNTSEKNKVFYLIKESVKQFKALQKELKENYYTAKELSELYTFSKNFWSKALVRHQPIGVFSTRFDKTVRIPKKFAEAYINQRSVPEGFICTNEIIEILDGIHTRVITNLRKDGVLGETYSGLTPEGDSIVANHIDKVLELKRNIAEEVSFIKENDYLSPNEIRELFPYDVTIDTVRRLFSAKTFDDIYIRQYSYKKEPVNYAKRESVLRYIDGLNDFRFSTAETPLEIFNEGVQKLNIPNYFAKTAEVYIDYCQNNIASSEASFKTLNSKARIFVIRLRSYIQYFIKELADHTDKEIELAFASDKLIQSDKERLVGFLNHLSFVQDTKYEKTYTLELDESNDIEDEVEKVYEFEQFLDYYYFVKVYDNHIAKAIESRDYAITWLYVAVHLTNAWRHGDVVRLPKINLKEMGITSLDYFRFNKLTNDQAGQILAQIEKHRMVKLIVSKTKFRRSFYANKSLRIPIATAYAIAQLHSNAEKDRILINFKTKYNIPYDKPFNLFFGERKDLKNFSSLKMNRSLVEHLYYSIYKKKGFAYSAYEFSKRVRAHKVAPNKVFSEVTQIYIRQNNENGPIDDIAVELFERGEMGYLYSMILRGTKELEGAELTLKSETALIKEFKEKYPPMVLEGMVKFVQSRQHQKAALAQELLLKPKKKLNEMIDKFYLGKMPSKHKDYHCLTYPNCHNPESQSCSTCIIGIAKASVMQSLKDELDEKIYSLSNAKSWGSVLKELSLLNALLDRLSEVTVDTNKGYVNEFINLNELSLKISNTMIRVESLKRLNENKG
ncbi:hypothetical protein ACQKGD_10090 [Peribacillus frigoritolerans]|uniref:hypothetical protein n=1 Tax=Peribacillus frigoritolerans TaxID=450367 RepID=UPI00207AECF2|nr:hypothetical protein [Peribacillus frigoritolerans]USK62844.1 hypothetical protein LIT26_16390 [Peribacillus frigoritolerans]